MVAGLERFIEKFRDYTDCYTIIGGTACDILMSDVGVAFRATKDIDMILIMETESHEFVETFWAFIKEGGYKCGWRNSDRVHFYRFTEPKSDYPYMIELFSKGLNDAAEAPNGIIPIHIDDDTSSLSAILLNDDYYQFMLEGRKVVNGISVLDAEHLIPFKMFAWLDLKTKKAAGEHVNDRDMRKHKYDVFRLLQIANRNLKIVAKGLVKEKIKQFLNEIPKEEIPFKQLGMLFDMNEAIKYLNDIYG
ncbi:MAG: hypothetical protein II707_09735 [Spirochaetales bacterium]|nr:hypothetical protein [Spirochaetales bacterium]